MGADIKALRGRIKSVDSTLHLTKAMGLVASSKIRRATDAMQRGREYAKALSQVVRALTACPECGKSPYMRAAEGGRTKLIVIAGDRGLAGGYNANVFRLAATFPDAELVPIGKRACDRYGAPTVLSEHFDAKQAQDLAASLCREFCDGTVDRVGVLHTRYLSMLSQEAEVMWLLPLTRESSQAEHGMLFEPDELTVLDLSVPTYVAGMLTAAVRESFACEVAARRTAMDSAGKNAQQMIEDLQLQYNRARQGAITQEITEIVAGSGA